MNRPRDLEIHHEAGDELDEAETWYREQSPRAAERFEAAVEVALERICSAPETYPEHLHGTRRLLLKRFPYRLVYVVLEDLVHLVAAPHESREPGYWAERLKEVPGEEEDQEEA